MPEEKKPFVVTDRRKFTLDGEVRPDAERSHDPDRPVEATPPQPQPVPAPEPVAAAIHNAAPEDDVDDGGGSAERDAEAELPAPTAEQTEQSRRAYEQTADRLETAIRATNPGMEHPPAMNFEGLVQSIYMTAIMQLGGATPEGEQPRVDLLGARSSIDMMGVLAEKTEGNLNDREQKFVNSALFELRMAFLEMTQALARSAQARAGGPAGVPGAPGAPTLVR